MGPQILTSFIDVAYLRNFKHAFITSISDIFASNPTPKLFQARDLDRIYRGEFLNHECWAIPRETQNLSDYQDRDYGGGCREKLLGNHQYFIERRGGLRWTRSVFQIGRHGGSLSKSNVPIIVSFQIRVHTLALKSREIARVRRCTDG
jgi:hypothetical protein